MAGSKLAQTLEYPVTTVAQQLVWLEWIVFQQVSRGLYFASNSSVVKEVDLATPGHIGLRRLPFSYAVKPFRDRGTTGKSVANGRQRPCVEQDVRRWQNLGTGCERLLPL